MRVLCSSRPAVVGFVIVGLMVTLMAGGCASEHGESVALAGYDFGSIDKVAVLSPTGDVYGDAVKDQIVSFFVHELMVKGYSCVERSKVQEIEQELNFQASDTTSSQGTARIGEILNVPVVMIVNIPQFEAKHMSLNARLVRVEDGTILWTGEGSGKTGKGLTTILSAAVGAAGGAVLAGGDSDDRLIGALAGGVLGGIVGNAMSPEKAEQVKKIIREKVCKELPSRFGA
ncbi:MAG: glycine zipper 2TM domain-containing protein [Planctomycetes bacterium]|nr:glycine zipper 2TM domain-containing protein [Planctomycetota bacterium]